MDYERATWSSILNLLEEVSFGSPKITSKTVPRARLQAFYTAFEDIYKNQTGWLIPNKITADDLRISISRKVIQAYGAFVGEHENKITADDLETFVDRYANTFSEKYIKYTADDLEKYVLDLFEGARKSLDLFERVPKLYQSFGKR